MNLFSFQILSQCTNKMYSKCLGPSFYVAFCPRRVAQVSTILPSFISATHSFFIRIACSSLLLLLMLNPCYVQIISHTRAHLNWKTYMDRPRLKCQDLSETQARKHGRMDGWMEGRIPQQKRRNHYTCLGWTSGRPFRPLLLFFCGRSAPAAGWYLVLLGLMHSCGHRIMSA